MEAVVGILDAIMNMGHPHYTPSPIGLFAPYQPLNRKRKEVENLFCKYKPTMGIEVGSFVLADKRSN